MQPNATLNVFPFDDDYSFGVIHSNIHWLWWTNKCSTLGGTYRYTNESIWDTFPWPQKPSQKNIERVAKAAKSFRVARSKAMKDYNLSLRNLYQTLEQHGKNNLKDLHPGLPDSIKNKKDFISSDCVKFNWED